MARAVTTTAMRTSSAPLATLQPLPDAIAHWWPTDRRLPSPAALALLADVLAPESIPYDEMRERRAVLVPELVESLRVAVARIEHELAEPVTTVGLVTWMGPLNIASGNPVDAAELTRRATAILQVLPNLPAVALVDETRCLLRGDYTPNLEGVRQVVERAVAPRYRLVSKLRLLIRLAPPPELARTRPEPKLEGNALLRHARNLVALWREGVPGVASMQAQARVLVLHAEREDPDRAEAVARILAPLLAAVVGQRRRLTEGPDDPRTPLRGKPRPPLPVLADILSADVRARLAELPVPGLPSGGGGGGTRTEKHA